MDNLPQLLVNNFNLDLTLEPFGDNHARENVFLGTDTTGNQYIIKLENIDDIKQIELSIQIANALNNSTNLSSSNYLKTTDGHYFFRYEKKIITIQVKEDIKPLSTTSNIFLESLGEALGEFHNTLLNLGLKNLKQSDFYNDFMENEVPLAQIPERLEEIKSFYKKYTPDYTLLTKGVVHNDLNSNNIFLKEDKYFFIDFELLSHAPLISDLGVLLLHLWDHNKGVEDYNLKLTELLKGYEKVITLSKYDKDNIIIFSLRYLFSDENWYVYWSKNGNPDAVNLIPEVLEKEVLLLKVVRKN